MTDFSTFITLSGKSFKSLGPFDLNLSLLPYCMAAASKLNLSSAGKTYWLSWVDLAPGGALIYMQPPLTCLFMLLMFSSLSVLSEKNPMALFLGSTAFLYEPVIR